MSRFSLPSFSLPHFSLQPPLRRALVYSLCLLVVGGTAGWYLQSKKADIAYAHGPLEITAAQTDAAGVAVTSDFIVKSNDGPLDPDMVRSIVAVTPKAAFSVSMQGATQATIHFAKALASSTIYRFTASAAQGSDRQQSWSFQTKNTFQAVSSLPANKATSVPMNSGIEVTFNLEGAKDIEKYVEITPKVEGHFEMHRRVAVFVPKALAPGTVYTVTVKKGLQVQDSDQALGGDYSFQFQTTTAQEGYHGPDVTFSRHMYEFPASQAPAFSTYANTADTALTAAVTAYAFPGFDQFASAIASYDAIPSWALRYDGHVDEAGLTKAIEFSAPMQRIDSGGYLASPQALPEGYYLVDLSIGGKLDQTFLQVTDTATYASVSSPKTLVWVNSVATKKAIAGAKIGLVGGSLSAQTAADGAALFDTPSQLTDAARQASYLSVTTPDGKKALVPLGGEYSSAASNPNETVSGAVQPSDNYWSYLYVDRPLYQPTDTVQFWGILRPRDGSSAAKTYSAVLTDYRNHSYGVPQSDIVVSQQDVTAGSTGTFLGKIALKNLETGTYTLTLRSGDDVLVSAGIDVETYTKPAYKITLKPDRQAIFADEVDTVRGQVSFYEGTPVPSMRLKYSSDMGGTGEVVTDAAGNFSIPFTSAYSEMTGSYPRYYPGTSTITVQPALAEEGGITGQTQVQVFGPHLQIQETQPDGGNVALISVNKIDLKSLNDGTASLSAPDAPSYLGAPAANQALTGRLLKSVENKQEDGTYYDFLNKVTVTRYKYTTTTVPVADVSLTTDASGKASYAVPSEKGVNYTLELRADDGQGRNALSTSYVYVQDPSAPVTAYSLSIYDKDKLYGQSDTVAEGDSLSMRIESNGVAAPSGGDNRYLFSVAKLGLRSYDIESNPRYDMAYSRDLIPNAAVGGVYFTGKTYMELQTRGITFDTSSRKLAISVVPDKQQYAPGDSVKLSVTAKDAKGNPQKADVNLNAVDEALYGVSAQSAPDPLSDLYKRLTTGLLYSYVSHQYPSAMGGGGGGGCFLSGTQILMQGGQQKAIEDVQVGDTVLTRSSEASGQLVSAKVLKTFSRVVGEYLLINGNLQVTPEHVVFANGKWTTAGSLSVGDSMLGSDGTWQAVQSIESYHGAYTVYNLEIDNYHTFFANRLYVHNSKGDRSDFSDTAYFSAIQTDASGKATVTFKLPDNLTTWRLNYQGVDGSLDAGGGMTGIAVSQPFFVNPVMATSYLAGDTPSISLRSFGDKLGANQKVSYTVSIPGVTDHDLTAQATGTAAVSVALPQLKEGNYSVTVTGTTGDLKDGVTRTISVASSRLTQSKVSPLTQLTDGWHPTDPATGQTTLAFSDRNRGGLYAQLMGLTNAYGGRLDEKVAAIEAAKLLNDSFGQKLPIPATSDIATYQKDDGGLSLLPYGGSDVALSARVAASDPTLFDKNLLKDYFTTVLNDAKGAREQALIALYGLASLDEPVLTSVLAYQKVTDLSVREQLYLGLAEAKLGDTESSLALLDRVVKQNKEQLTPGYRLKIGNDANANYEVSVLATGLAALTAYPERDGLYQYVSGSGNAETMPSLDEFAYLRAEASHRPTGSVSFSYSLNGKDYQKKLENGEVFSLELAPADLATLRVGTVKGNVGLVTYSTVPLATSDTGSKDGLAVSRKYEVNGKAVTSVANGDLVKVTLTPSLGSVGVDGCYEITDSLPAGLKLVSASFDPQTQTYDPNLAFPYAVTGQQASFCAYAQNGGKTAKPVVYYARVVAGGTFTAEGAVIRPAKASSVFALSKKDTLTIR